MNAAKTFHSSKKTDDGFSSDVDAVLDKWKTDYEKLFNSGDNGNFDNNHLGLVIYVKRFIPGRLEEKSSWDYRVLQLARKYSRIQNVEDEINMSNVWDSIQTFEKESWYHEVWNDKNNVNGNKLRFYRLFKTCIGTEPYVKVVNNRCHRCILSLFRAGSLQLKVETGRYARPPEPLQDRLCIFCDSGQIEDEKHILFNCCFYSDIRHVLSFKC
ncbi:unnamed protein product [Mytilus coruscus]|uniref:Uncharacterized protein n=1 Tax=Mytilus coruscus TaxID=42192 RepID=A0A6J8B829_MYTCO|nr:unnamed protein product [Mytilus coruscus]